MRKFGPDWVLGADGLYSRTAARVIPLDPSQRVLLIRGHDENQRERSWWFTVGGGLNAYESAMDGAVRELYEETSISITTSELVGPVIHRSALLDYSDTIARQEEWYFLTFIDHTETDVNNQHWTDHEHQTLDEIRWWDIHDLEEESKTGEVFPKHLVTYLRKWVDTGWDGNLVTIKDEFLPTKK